MGLYKLAPYKVIFHDPVGEFFELLSLICEEEFCQSFKGESFVTKRQVEKLDDVMILLCVKDKLKYLK